MTTTDIVDICRACPDVKEIGPTLFCSICKCNIHLKAKLGPLLGKRCPLGKW